VFAADDDPGKPNPVTTGVAKAVGKVRADKDILAVLNAHASLNPKATRQRRNDQG
jgi:acetyl esterase